MYGSEEQQTSRRSHQDGFATYDYTRGFDGQYLDLLKIYFYFLIY